jgi:hypothetical protein
MKLRTVLGPLAAVTLLGTAACARHPAAPASGSPATSQTRTVGSFSKIELRGTADVEVREGRDAKIVANTGRLPVDTLITRVENDTLIIDTRNEACFGFCIDTDDESPHVVVDMPRLDAVAIDGAGDVTVDGAGEHTLIELKIEGSGDLRYSGKADVLRCSIEGSGDVVLRGESKRLEVRIDGSGDVDARDFPAQGGSVAIDGSGDVTGELHGDVSVAIHGSGDLRYSGDARFTQLDLSGSGEVHRR